jgi:tetratricopeptide (TPR) repeat protein
MIRLLILSLLIVSCQSKTAKQYLLEADKKIESGDHRSAILLLTKAIEKNTLYKDAYYLRGFCYDFFDKTDSAIIDFKKLLDIDSVNQLAAYSIGLSMVKQKKFEDAVRYFNRALGSDTAGSTLEIEFIPRNRLEDLSFRVNNEEIWYERGLTYYNLGEIRKAFYDFNYCIDGKYQLPECNYMIGLCWLKSNNRDKACISFRQAAFYGDSLANAKLAGYNCR